MSGIVQLLLGAYRAATAAVDPFFNYVTALLHGDGTNGAQNNTFLDSSTNNFTITRNGNTTQGTFSPFSQTGWSNYFSSSYITQSSSITFGTNSYTIEFWVNQSSRGTSPNWFDGVFSQTSGAVRQYIDIGGGEHNWVVYDGSTRQVNISLGTLPPLNTWTHYALVRNGNTFTAYINGAQVGTATSTYSIPAMAIQIGWVGTADGYLNGYISNFRAVNGTAVYTSAFTPPTSPLTAITNTALLTCQSNRFLDNSSNAFTFTVTGSPSVQAFSPFNPTSAWSASSNGGSGYFDGSGDYLITTSTQVIPTGSFTVEAWVYLTTSSTAVTVVAQGTNANSARFSVGIEGGLWWTQIGSSSINVGTPILNTWTHLAVTFNGSTLTLYVNGTSVGTVATSTSAQNTTLRIGSLGPADWANYYWPGYISQVRVSNTVRTISVPTAPYSSDGNTTFLASFTNAGIYDNAAVGDYETVGNAQVSTSVKKYGTGSMAFDGTGDKIVAPFSQWLQMGSSDWTIEMWLYLNAAPGGGLYYGLYVNRASTANYSPITIFVNSARQIEAYFSTSGSSWTSSLTTGQTIATTTWTHVAVVKIGTLVKVYFNGTADGSTATISGSLFTNTAQLWVGGENGGNDLNGYIDDFRITKGIARYPYNFTPPTAAFPNIGGTVTLTADPYYNYTTLLLPGNGTNGAQNNTFLDSSSNAFTITRNGNTTQGNFSPFSQTGWGNYFGGGYLTFTGTTAVNLYASQFTFECWVYKTSTGLAQHIYGYNNATVDFWDIYIDTSERIVFRYNGNTANITTTQTVPLAQWTHIAVAYDGTTSRVFINGTLAGSAASGIVTANGNYTANIGINLYTGGVSPFYGYMSNMRIIKGSALYTTNFTPPVTALTAVSGTSLLTCQSNRFVDNSTNAYALTATNSPSVQAFSPFAPTAAYSASTVGGSGYFDGSGDYLSGASWASAGQFGTSDFTIECWAYMTNAPQSNQVIISCNIYPNTTGIYLQYKGGAGTDVVVAAGASAIITSSAGWSFNAWHHIAVTRSGSTMTLWIDGVSRGTATFTNNLSDGLQYIGRPSDVANYMPQGYISNLRIVKGTAVYTSTFTPPTAPVTAITNTSLLLNYTNGGIVDATAKNDMETVGNSQVSTAQSKFGGSSMYFDGTGDWLAIPASQNITLGTGDFTIEMWVYAGNQSGTAVRMMGNGAGAGWGAGKWIMTTYSTAGYVYQFNWWNYSSGTTGALIGTSASNTSTWNHVAVTRYGNTWKLFVNGVAESTVTSSTSLDGGTPVEIRVGSGGVSGDADWAGYIDDLRITKGIARYTSNFTPPTSAFLLQ